MAVDTVVTLIAYTQTQDSYGVLGKSNAIGGERLAKVESVGRSEFFAAGKTGLRPALKFTLFRSEWSGEMELEHEGQRYAVYRTYQVPGTDYLELWTERKGGVH